MKNSLQNLKNGKSFFNGKISHVTEQKPQKQPSLNLKAELMTYSAQLLNNAWLEPKQVSANVYADFLRVRVECA
jgi:hypothetical protein